MLLALRTTSAQDAPGITGEHPKKRVTPETLLAVAWKGLQK